MRRSTRRSVAPVVVEDSGDTTVQVGNLNTRFSFLTFVKRVEKLTVDQRNAITKVGFGNLLLLHSHMMSKTLLAALMDRWSCEKGAFTLIPGAITITLMDIALILGLRVIGRPVILRDDEPFTSLEEQYGATSLTRKITVASLESRLDSIGGAANHDFVRTFLLFTFGTLLFPDANGKVDARYLSLLKNVDDIYHLAWGAAVLEDLLMWLKKRKEENVQYMGGCLMLLQIWSYEHIDIARPNLLNSGLQFPRACRWENSRPHQRQWFTTRFKELQDNQMTWELQPTSDEVKIDFIEELLGAANANGVSGVDDTSDTVSAVSVIDVESEVGTPGTSCSNDTKSECDIVPELYNNFKNGGFRRSVTSEICSHVVDAGNRLDMDTAINTQPCTEQVLCSKDLMTSNFVPDVHLDTIKHISTSSIAEQDKHAELLSECQEPLMDFTNEKTTNSDICTQEDDMRRRNQLLQELNIELKKDMENLKIENSKLQSQILSNQLQEEDNMELKKKIENLNSENGKLRSQALLLEEQNSELIKLADELRRKDQSADNLVVQLEALLVDMDMTDLEEMSS